MALIKTTAIVDSISGKLNGTVFAKNKGGAYMRSKSTVSNPNTQAQSAVRAVFSSISQTWRDLTEEEQKAWIDQAPNYPYTNRLGDSKTLTGKALFQQLNNNLMSVGGSIDRTPNTPKDVVGAQTLVSPLTIDANNVAINFELALAAPLTEPTYYVLEATPPLSPGVTNAKNQYRRIGQVTMPALTDALLASDFTDIDLMYTNAFGLPIEGAKVFFRIKAINENGQASPYFSMSTVVVDTTP